MSFAQDTFLDKLKLTRMVPIYKSEDKKGASNYRSISVLFFLLKNIKKILKDYLVAFIEKK